MKIDYYETVNERFRFGKYRDRTIKEILTFNPAYILFITENYQNIEFDVYIVSKANELVNKSKKKKYNSSKKIKYEKYVQLKDLFPKSRKVCN